MQCGYGLGGTLASVLGVLINAYGWRTALVADYYGRRRYATIYGFAQFAMIWGTIGGPLLAGYALDTTGSYLPALYVFAAANALGMMVALIVRQPCRAIAAC